MVCKSILLFESIKKTLDTYLHIFETIIKPITLYAYESWGFCDKKSMWRYVSKF